jgi:hypothetical protein
MYAERLEQSGGHMTWDDVKQNLTDTWSYATPHLTNQHTSELALHKEAFELAKEAHAVPQVVKSVIGNTVATSNGEKRGSEPTRPSNKTKARPVAISDPQTPVHAKDKNADQTLRSVYTLIHHAHTILGQGHKMVTGGTGLPHNMAAGRKWKCATTASANFKLVRLNWEAISTCFKLAYGEIKGSVNAPKNRRTVMKQFRLIRSMVFGDIKKTVKSFAHQLREKQMGCTVQGLLNRGKSKEALFLASTIARGIQMPKPSKEELQSEVTSAIARLTSPAPLPDQQTMNHLSEFVRTTLRRAKMRMTERSLPLPGVSSCFEQSQRNGGSAHVFTLHRQYSAEERAVMIEEKAVKAAADRFHDKVMGSLRKWATKEEFEREFNLSYRGKTADEMVEEERRSQYRALGYDNDDLLLLPSILKSCRFRSRLTTGRKRNAAEHFRKVLEDAKNRRVARLNTIVGPDGKIRIATTHSSSVAWAARCMTKLLLPTLKGIATTRDILKNRQVRLRTSRSDPIIYSADLSKATDPISIDLSRFVLEAITSRTGKPEWWDDALDATIAKQLVSTETSATAERTWEELKRLTETKTPTTAKNHFISECGALMGLGPGWVVLCLVNAFAAEAAGAELGSYAICGDDLVGLWPREVADRYEQNLAKLGLEANTSKSFRSEDQGVFCERQISRVKDVVIRGKTFHVATSRTHARIAEAVGMRAIANRNGRAVVDDLTRLKGHKYLTSAARRVARREAPARDKIPGMLADGGQGFGRPTGQTLLSYLLNGPVRLTQESLKDDRAKNDAHECTLLRRAVRAMPPCGSGHRMKSEDLLVEARKMQTFDQNQTGRCREAPARRKLTEIRKDLDRRAKRVSGLIKSTGSLTAAVEAALNMKEPYVRNDPSTCKRVLRHVRAGRLIAALNAAKRSWQKTVNKHEGSLQLHTTLCAAKRIEPPVSLDGKSSTPAAWSFHLLNKS